MQRVTIIVLAMLAMIGFMAHPNEAISCSDVYTKLEPCLTYLKAGGTPSEDCCNGVKSLNVETQTTSDKQVVCSCAKDAAIRFQIKEDVASSLPTKCDITVTVPVTPSVNCSSITYEGYK